MVNKRASTTALIAVVPVPGVDVGGDILIMLEILPKINIRFGLSPDQIEELDSATKAQIAVIITSIGSKLIGKVITKETITLLLSKFSKRIAVKQVAKFVPFIGQACSAAISFTAMK